jgi:GxxExxY protein
VAIIHEELSRRIIGAAIEVHKSLGPGLLESAYQTCMCRESSLQGIGFQKELEVPVEYKGVKLDCGYRIDILVENVIVLEWKAVAEIQPIHIAQLMTYLRLADKRVGLLMNFNVDVMKNGITRRVL